jgi:hypothetical protein
MSIRKINAIFMWKPKYQIAIHIHRSTEMAYK